MSGSGENLGSPWPPLAIRPWNQLRIVKPLASVNPSSVLRFSASFVWCSRGSSAGTSHPSSFSFPYEFSVPFISLFIFRLWFLSPLIFVDDIFLNTHFMGVW
jgi:hypothetical protein